MHATAELRTVDEVARELRVTRATVYRAIGAGRLDAVRVGESGPLRIPAEAVDRFVVPAGEARRRRPR